MDAIHYIIAGLWGALGFCIGVVWKVMNEKIGKQGEDLGRLKDDVGTFKIKVAEEYVKADALRIALDDATAPIMRELEKIDKKLDSKADR
jgi:hypothetical protein